MKKILPVLFLFIPAWVSGQVFPGMTPEQSQMLMQQMQSVSNCMAKLDQGAFQQMEIESAQFMSEVQGMCAAGQRDAAQRKAMAYLDRMKKNPLIVGIKRCNSLVDDSMKALMPPDFDQDMFADMSQGHVCDNL